MVRVSQRFLMVVSISAVVACAGATARAAAPVGGPPTLSENRCSSFIGPCGDPIVLGIVRTGFDGPVEVVGMSWAAGTCIYFDKLRHRSGAGYCSESPPLEDGEVIKRTMALQPTRRTTEVTGAVSEGIDSVRIRYRSRGSAKQRKVEVVEVPPELASRIGAPGPFGVFELTVRRCIPSGRFRASTRTSAGNRVVVRWRRTPSCRRD